MNLSWKNLKTFFGKNVGDSFKEFVAEAPLWISFFDKEGVFQAINRTGLSILQAKEDEIIGKSIFQLWTPPQYEVFSRALEQAFAGHSEIFSAEFDNRGGKSFTFSICFFSSQSKSSSDPFIVGIFNDVTHFKKHGEALQRTLSNRLDTSTNLLVSSEQRFRSVVDGSPDWISLFNRDGVFQTINPAGYTTLGLPENRILGRNLWEFFPIQHEPDIKDGVERVKRGEKCSFEARFHAPGRESLYLKGVLNPIPESDGSIQKFVGIFLDLTDAKKAEEVLRKHRDELEVMVQKRTEELQKTNEILQSEIVIRRETEAELRHAKEIADAANLAKSEFLANMSHEIRTPMNSVLGFTSLLMKTQLTEKQLDYLQTVQSSGRQLLSLLEEILDLSKIEAGKLVLESEPFEPPSILNDVLILFFLKAEEKGIKLTSSFSPPLPFKVLGDQTRIRQILVNLVGNAVKFTKKGKVEITATWKETTTPNRIVFHAAVKDTGIGIALKDQGKLFKKFSQADSSTTRKFGGTGLGLAICRELVDLMGGSIHLESTLGEGSVFTVAIPLECTQNREETEKINVNQAPGPSSSKPFMAKVLLVEDEAESLKLLLRCFEDLSCQTISALNGQEALEMAGREKFDLIIMDWAMPILDGLEATKAIRQGSGPNKETPIVALTARAMKGDREECLKAGMNEYLTKPLDVDFVKSFFQKYLRLNPGQE